MYYGTLARKWKEWVLPAISWKKIAGLCTLAFLFAVFAIAGHVFLKSLIVNRFPGYGYESIILLGFVLNATIFVPPGVMMGATLPILITFSDAHTVFLAALLYASGSSVGELFSSYSLGAGSVKVLKLFGVSLPFAKNDGIKPKKFLWLYSWKGKTGWLRLAFLAGMPFPPFKIAGLLAGSTRYPLFPFFLACLVGRTAKYILILYLGSRILQFL